MKYTKFLLPVLLITSFAAHAGSVPGSVVVPSESSYSKDTYWEAAKYKFNSLRSYVDPKWKKFSGYVGPRVRTGCTYVSDKAKNLYWCISTDTRLIPSEEILYKEVWPFGFEDIEREDVCPVTIKTVDGFTFFVPTLVSNYAKTIKENITTKKIINLQDKEFATANALYIVMRYIREAEDFREKLEINVDEEAGAIKTYLNDICFKNKVELVNWLKALEVSALLQVDLTIKDVLITKCAKSIMSAVPVASINFVLTKIKNKDISKKLFLKIRKLINLHLGK